MSSKADATKSNTGANAKKEPAQTPTSQPNEKLNVLEEDDEFEEFEDGEWVSEGHTSFSSNFKLPS